MIDRVDDAAVIAAQHAALVRDADRGRALAQAVHQARGGLAPQHVLAAEADGAHVVRPGIHRRDQARDLLRRVLQVGIQRDDVSAARLRERGENRHVLAGIACQHHHARDVRPLLKLFAQLAPPSGHCCRRPRTPPRSCGRGRRAPGTAARTAAAAPPLRCRPARSPTPAGSSAGPGKDLVGRAHHALDVAELHRREQRQRHGLAPDALGVAGTGRRGSRVPGSS